MVQTAYANGSSTKYLKDKLQLTQKYAPNGVKNSHPVAHKFDFGIYCESNGHGTFTIAKDKMHYMEELYALAGQKAAQSADFAELYRLVGLLFMFSCT